MVREPGFSDFDTNRFISIRNRRFTDQYVAAHNRGAGATGPELVQNSRQRNYSSVRSDDFGTLLFTGLFTGEVRFTTWQNEGTGNATRVRI